MNTKRISVLAIFSALLIFFSPISSAQSTAVIASYQGEFDALLTALEGFELEEIQTINGTKFHIGEAYGQDLILFQSGLGLVNAAMTMQMALDHFDIERILLWRCRWS